MKVSLLVVRTKEITKAKEKAMGYKELKVKRADQIKSNRMRNDEMKERCSEEGKDDARDEKEDKGKERGRRKDGRIAGVSIVVIFMDAFVG